LASLAYVVPVTSAIAVFSYPSVVVGTRRKREKAAPLRHELRVISEAAFSSRPLVSAALTGRVSVRVSTPYPPWFRALLSHGLNLTK
jgi:hypothetical protein